VAGVYSASFQVGVVHTTLNEVIPNLDAGHTWVIRQITLCDPGWDSGDYATVFLPTGSGDVQIFATPTIGLDLETGISMPNPPDFAIECRIVLPYGESIGILANQGDWHYYVGGYRLTTP